jgi:hypothetical protein
MGLGNTTGKLMSTEADLRFLGEAVKRLQHDIRHMRLDFGLRAKVARLEHKLDAFAADFDSRFDQLADLIRSGCETLGNDIRSVRCEVHKH